MRNKMKKNRKIVHTTLIIVIIISLTTIFLLKNTYCITESLTDKFISDNINELNTILENKLDTTNPYYMTEIVDENGIVVPDAALRLSAAVEGVGSLAAFGSSNPITDENYTSGTFTSYHGTATAIIRSGYQTGMCTLTVGCEGLDEKKIAFTIK